MASGFCKYNLTLLVVHVTLRELVFVDSNKKVYYGPLAEIYNTFVGDNFKLECDIMLTKFIGGSYSNSTSKWSTGSYKLLEDKKVDLVLHATSLINQLSSVRLTYPLVIELFVASHPIDKFIATNSSISIFEMINLDSSYFIFTIILNSFSLMLIFFSLFKLTKKTIYSKPKSSPFIKKFKFLIRILIKVLDKKFKFVTKKKVYKMGLLLFLICLSHFYTKLFISNSFKMYKVLIDTSQIIENEKQLMNTNKRVCWAKKDVSYFIATNKYETSIFKKIYERKTQKGCFAVELFYSFDPKLMSEFRKKGFVFASLLFTTVFAKIWATNSDEFFWISPEIISRDLSFYFRSSLKNYQIKHIQSKSLNFLESGLSTFNYRKSAKIVSGHFHSSKVFRTIQEVKQEYTKFIPINIFTFANFLYLISYIYLVLIIIFILNEILVISLKKIKKSLF